MKTFLSIGIDVGADFSLMSAALPTQEIIGRSYTIFHNNPASLQSAVDRIRALELQNNLKAKIFMESTSIYHYPLYYRLKDEGFDVFIINPIVTHANSNINIRGIHNDKFDSRKIALLGLTPDLKTSIVPNDNVSAQNTCARIPYNEKGMLTVHMPSDKSAAPDVSAIFIAVFQSKRQSVA